MPPIVLTAELTFTLTEINWPACRAVTPHIAERVAYRYLKNQLSTAQNVEWFLFAEIISTHLPDLALSALQYPNLMVTSGPYPE